MPFTTGVFALNIEKEEGGEEDVIFSQRLMLRDRCGMETWRSLVGEMTL